MIKRLDFQGNPYLGVFGVATDEAVLLSPVATAKQAREVGRALDAPVVQTMVSSSVVIGALVAANAHGALVASFATDAELEAMRALRPRRLRHRLNAVGNNVLCNGNGALVHPDYDAAAVKAVEEALGVPARRGTVAGMRTVGSAAVATSRGAVCHPHVTEAEQAVLEEVLGVPVVASTANYGTPQVGACLLSNARGAVVGTTTTPIEVGRIEEALRLY